MFLKRFCIKKSFIRQGIFLAFISSVAFNALNADELKTCESEEDQKVGCIVKRYYENGNLDFETQYKNDKQEGIKKWYYENGNLMEETPYKNGKYEGVVKEWYENGNILSEIPFMNGKLHGSVKLYSKKLIWQTNAQNGKLINGKCTNGKTLTNAHSARINKDINEAKIGGDFWYEICNN